MKLISFLRQQTETWGAVRGNEVIDLRKVLGGTLADFIASQKFADPEKVVAAHKPDLKLSEITFLPVIPRPEKIVCAVRNYRQHDASGRGAMDACRTRRHSQIRWARGM
jgi:2-keto-4-pentenoate hydratase/2-oxohepta-3-ene-1,7-dioic acid hydratase in catechol pathway